ncbi:uncharacterized protein BO97DRAFT_133989 [Aspergillus homomorphus CBS 101889]|uniref:Uncharacterized protein n=1 Tax=Aspergillus homomorphus (strain CBS 101889) TaxID=1450537 RepID=A0A395I8F8_ASPHC|nr:hypothetical protein BO97DRAFT_133989 [Aspergillus homomorphus CBS 101889]RAL16437.1 hypothetical protein BO97DRAFT_133989 [Aspergillus homomorphus CBS 101889]
MTMTLTAVTIGKAESGIGCFGWRAVPGRLGGEGGDLVSVGSEAVLGQFLSFVVSLLLRIDDTYVALVVVSQLRFSLAVRFLPREKPFSKVSSSISQSDRLGFLFSSNCSTPCINECLSSIASHPIHASRVLFSTFSVKATNDQPGQGQGPKSQLSLPCGWHPSQEKRKKTPKRKRSKAKKKARARRRSQ